MWSLNEATQTPQNNLPLNLHGYAKLMSSMSSESRASLIIILVDNKRAIPDVFNMFFAFCAANDSRTKIYFHGDFLRTRKEFLSSPIPNVNRNWSKSNCAYWWMKANKKPECKRVFGIFNLDSSQFLYNYAQHVSESDEHLTSPSLARWNPIMRLVLEPFGN